MPEQVDAIAVYQQLLENRTNGHGSVVRSARSVRELTTPSRAATGVTRLDELLGGGLPTASATLLYGPPFTGKGVLERQFFLRGIQSLQPSIYMLTDNAAADTLERLALAEPNIRRHADSGTAQFIDSYSRMIGDEEPTPGTHFLEDVRSLTKAARIVDQIDHQLKSQGRGIGRLVIQSLSTIMMEAGSAETFRFLRQIVGRVARRGGTVLAGLEAGMHPEPDVQAIKHLCNGMIQTREVDEKFFLRIEGLPTQYHPGWVEYEFTPERFELTGSFSSERIRGTTLAA